MRLAAVRGLTRRDLLAGAATAVLLPGRALAGAPLPELHPGRTSPIAPVTAPSPGWLGDDPDAAHGRLWAIDTTGASAPEEADLVVVGGGISGLATAWRLRDRAPVLLEAAPRFGGNSRGERWEGIDYSLGAAYFAWAPKGSALSKAFYRPLELHKLWRTSSGEHVLWDGEVREGFWEGATDPEHAGAFVRAERYLRDVLDHHYPDMPPGEWKVLTDEELADLDRRTLVAELERGTGGPLHPHLRVMLEAYCRSAFGAGAEEVSAAAGLNFLAAELDPICALPGGNARVAERLWHGLSEAVPPANLRAGAVALEIARDGERVRVVYASAEGVRTLSARAVVVACPKFVAAKICADLPDDQRAAIGRLRWRAYTVANLLCRKPAPAEALDLYFLSDPLPEPGTKASDLLASHWAKGGDPDHSVFTLYRPLPTDGGRAELLDPASVDRFRADALAEAAEILPLVGLSAEDVVETRVSRFGHALPLAEPGLVADGTLALVRRPIGDRIFFANQDDWALPSLETCLTRALEVEEELRRVLG